MKEMATCNDFMEFAGAWMEGEHLPGAEEHIRSCARCRTLIADLEAIRAVGRALAAEEVNPPPHVWLRIRAGLEAEGLIRNLGWFDRLSGLFSEFSRPALVGAYASLLLVGALFLGFQTDFQSNQEQWLTGTQSAAASVDTELQAVERGSLEVMANHEHDPAVSASLNQNLAIVDNLISVCEKNVQEDPGNEMARDYLYGAYQQKADLLATMGDRGVNTQ
jgi:hypothetical protein